jgi:hypothetical protein
MRTAPDPQNDIGDRHHGERRVQHLLLDLTAGAPS